MKSISGRKPIYHGVTEAGEHVTIEEYIKGAFVKYINNDGTISKAITGEDGVLDTFFLCKVRQEADAGRPPRKWP